MKALYEVDSRIAKHLCSVLATQEKRWLIEQKALLSSKLKKQLKDFNRKDLQAFKRVILKAYDRKKGRNYFYESLLSLLEQHLKSRG